jgi:hypothetical protein
MKNGIKYKTAKTNTKLDEFMEEKNLKKEVDEKK